MDPKLIVIDGKTYHGVNEMPADVRRQYEQAMQSLGNAMGSHAADAFGSAAGVFRDKDQDGVPDILESMTTSSTVVRSTKIIVDGQEYNDLASLPPEARARYEEAMGKLDTNRNGVPDFAEGMLKSMSVNASPDSREARRPSVRATSPSAGSVITPDTSNGWILVLSGLFLLLLCLGGAGALWYFFLR